MSVLQSGRILVVDDDVQIRRALRHTLITGGYHVSEASSGEEALERATLEPPSLIILDLSMPGMSGFDVCKEFRTWTNVPILILSVKDREQDKIIALDLGADDYLTKPFDTGELLARIRANLRRVQETQSNKAVFEMGELKVELSRRQVFLKGEEVKLTKTEFGLLAYLIQNEGRVLTHSQLLAKVWGAEYAGDIQTLRVHAGNLRRKIEPDPTRPCFLLTEPGVGYRFAHEI